MFVIGLCFERRKKRIEEEEPGKCDIVKPLLHDLVLHGGIASGRGGSGCSCAVGGGCRCDGIRVEVLAHLSIKLLDSLGLGTASSATLATTTTGGLGSSTTSSSVYRLGCSGSLGLVVLLLSLRCPVNN
jgi:hypothetical protein